ncbi:crotonase/enoyl-CoA hydratase family protein [Stakelama saccharophila]|uniref:Crotonase/enoyl-CoA hydratase family protein n=1 Tax=Stakelama saccharophila TaxID=3075605 RepID=A0ABZ0B9Z8_9SPHN|nr:crotonase/enoyl-CoA hydratase family protein [Stakelama sp. W311]WNO53905.1 crotonase/enoyl-CoA hydratase family protein [Stakelama sp. W311]
MTGRRVTIDMDGHVAEVRLARPDKRNALDPAMFDAIAGAIDALSKRAGLRAVVLSGEGRAFCAGLDVTVMASGGSDADLLERAHGLANRAQQVAWGWRTLPVPVIAAVHGIAFGGGLQIMSGADVRFAAPEMRLSAMEMKWGIVPDMAGFALWRGLVRDDHLRELIYTAREFDSVEALDFGFVSHVVDDPRNAAMALAKEIAARNPHAIRAAKRLATLAADADAAAILAAESGEQAKLLRSPNQIEAVRANTERRRPDFAD